MLIITMLLIDILVRPGYLIRLYVIITFASIRLLKYSDYFLMEQYAILQTMQKIQGVL